MIASDVTDALNSTSLTGLDKPVRSFFPIVNVMLKNYGMDIGATAVFDSGSEVNIFTPRCYQLLDLKGEPIDISIIGPGGIVTRVRTFARHDYYKMSFFPRTAREWNALPNDVVSIQTRDRFKEALKHM